MDGSQQMGAGRGGKGSALPRFWRWGNPTDNVRESQVPTMQWSLSGCSLVSQLQTGHMGQAGPLGRPGYAHHCRAGEGTLHVVGGYKYQGNCVCARELAVSSHVARFQAQPLRALTRMVARSLMVREFLQG